jgi:hypothetical protein
MPHFTVKLREQTIYFVDVDASTPADASRLAQEIWAATDNPVAAFLAESHGVQTLTTTEHRKPAPKPALASE